MKLLELARNNAFWFVDFLKGGKGLQYYNEIKLIQENPKSDEVLKIKKSHLNTLLKHAITSTVFYKEHIEYKSIEDFPVVNKNILKSNFDNFKSRLYLDKVNFSFSTSGSTGAPFTIFQDANKRLRSQMDTVFFSEKAGFKIGNKLTYFRLWNAFEKKGNLIKFFQNILPIDVFELQNKDLKSKVIKDLIASKSTNSWLGYASSYEGICKYLDENKHPPIPNKLKSIIAMSERLNDYTKDTMYKYFNTEVVSRYSNIENGILAQQPLGNKKYFEINEASYYVEILSLDSDKPLEDGQSGRIVITDLFNYCIPMIRYDTGDIGIKNSIDSKSIFTSVNGRKVDVIYDANGNIITVNLGSLGNNYPVLNQFQLIQRAKGTYHFKMNVNHKFDREEKFINEFRVYLGEEANISIEYVDEIPLLASGKRRVIVNEMVS